MPARRRSGISMSLLSAILEASSSSSSSSFCSSDDESSESSFSSSGDATPSTERENFPQGVEAYMEDASTTASNAQHSPEITSSGQSWDGRDFLPYWDDEWQTNHGTFRLTQAGESDRQDRRGATGDRSATSRLWKFMTCGDSDDSGSEAEERTPLTLTQRRLLNRRRQERAYRQQLIEENTWVSLRAIICGLLLASIMMAIALGAAAYINGGLHVPNRRHKGEAHRQN
ncbi:hypothetical protein PpBr36_04136 [Pyricularia pennisetigena]|uniref:hypothetical protein n=1 Tax=Pyricularia pennisetigena TaxID=1578925 RepID=UPI00114FD75D|nr:hypothetical protein PpBr36_04136 [Pyricularia pennisetigena]TLS26855.1 hypothetical protein PpBr36_04136 [Pyricularia pennisetigena]